MMSIRNQHLFYLVAIVAYLQNGICTSVHIEIDPETYNEVVTDELRISCTLNASLPNVKQVIMLEIWKKDQSPLAIIRQDEITSGPGLKPNMKAVGYINTNSGSSYLRLTIRNPAIEDAGTYSCVLFYLNDLFQLKEAKAYGKASVTVDENDIGAVVTYLMGKVSVLEKTTKKQGNLISEQRDTIEGQDSTLKRQEQELRQQEKELRQQEQEIRQQQTQDKRHEAAVDILQNKLTEQKNKIASQETKLKQQNDSMTEYEMKNYRQLMELKDEMIEQSANASYVSAFSYGYNSQDTFNVGNTLKFSVPILNTGDDYNPLTGMFTAPRNGLYSFHLVAMTYGSNVNLFIDLKAKGNTVASLLGYDYRQYSQSSVISVVSLMAGDKVWPVGASGTQGNILRASSYYSVFTGYLLRSINA